MRLRQTVLVTFLAFGLAPGLRIGEAGQQSAPRTGREALPEPGAAGEPPAFDAEQSAGLFVGVRTFRDDPSWKEVPFAVDDAVDLAHRFALGVSPPLIPASKVVLVLSGDPQKTASSERLEELLAAGARKAEAFPSDIKDWLRHQARAAGEAGLLVVAFATHGLKHRANEYLLTTSSLGHQIPETSIGVHTVLKEVALSPSWRRMVLLDACRDSHRPGTRAPSKARPARLEAALVAEGQVVLAARPEAVLYDDPGKGQGVFTAAVLDGMNCGSPLAEDGAITLEELANHVDDQVAKWVRSRPAIPGERPRGGISRTIEGSLGRFVLVHCP
jgi:hypothetical protein